MSEHQQTVRNLLILNGLDRQRYALQTELEQTPRRLASCTEELASADEESAEAARALADAENGLASSEAELGSTESRRQRAQERLSMLTTVEQVEATQREIAALGEALDALELEIIEKMEALDGLRERAEALTGEAERRRKELASGRVAWEKREPLARSEMQKLDATRAPIVADMRSDFLRRYQLAWRQKGRRSPSGVTRVEGLVCVTCNTEVSARWVQESKAWSAVHSCQTCKRLVLFDPDAPPPV